MKIMNCPLNGPRNIAEFVCGGEVRETPDPDRCTDAEWADARVHAGQSGGRGHRMVAARADRASGSSPGATRAPTEILETMTVREFMARRGQG